MSKQTQQEMLVASFLRMGWTRIEPQPSRKYVALTLASAKTNVYLGKAGALRMGRTVSASRPNDKLREALLKGAEARADAATVA